MRSPKLFGGNRVRVIFHESLAAWRRKDPDAKDALGLTECHEEAPHVATIHLPMPCSVQVIVHEAVHAAMHNARFRNLRGDEREEWICIDAGELASFMLRKWRNKKP